MACVALGMGWKYIAWDKSGAKYPTSVAQAQPQFNPRWKDAYPVARMDGDTSATIQLIEFADLECPFCAKFQQTVDSVRAQRPNSIAVLFVHLPIASHRFAIPAARAAECAAGEARFAGFAAAVFRKQDSLGLKSWTSFAVDAGLRDTSRFSTCITNTTLPLRIAEGQSLGKSWEIRATPTVYLNGWRQSRPPDASALLQAVDSIARTIRR